MRRSLSYKLQTVGIFCALASGYFAQEDEVFLAVFFGLFALCNWMYGSTTNE